MRDRVYCGIPGCHRFMFGPTCIKRWGTTNVRIICARHWRRLSKRERAVIHRLERKVKRYGEEAVTHERWLRVWDAIFRRAADPARIGREVGL